VAHYASHNLSLKDIQLTPKALANNAQTRWNSTLNIALLCLCWCTILTIILSKRGCTQLIGTIQTYKSIIVIAGISHTLRLRSFSFFISSLNHGAPGRCRSRLGFGAGTALGSISSIDVAPGHIASIYLHEHHSMLSAQINATACDFFKLWTAVVCKHKVNHTIQYI